ncbi:glycoside hydrolase family 25 protein [Nocardia sp. NPDC059240]|uniref:glycoside hydrolase family 25 protein n=1 Tax=Nocardia sp. NPDC059240 TaxID=3346786 RepID=UPI0036B1684D
MTGRSLMKVLTVAATGILMATPAGVAAADVEGPDVASYQHPGGSGINWFGVRAAGYQFAMLKATEGLSYVNPFFVQDSLSMRVAGVARGTYHFARPAESPELQGAFYSALVLGQNGLLDLPPVLDLEDSGGLPPDALIDWTHRYLNTVQAMTGRRPIIYTYPRFWRTAMADTNQFTSYPLWIADYRGNDQPEVPGGWPAWTFWQTTDSGAINGIGAGVDLNVYSGAQGDFGGFANIPFSGSASGSGRGSS